MFRERVRERLAPDLNAYLPFRRQRAGYFATFGRKQFRIRTNLLEAKRRLILTDLDLELRIAVPVCKEIEAAERRSRGVRTEQASGRVANRQGLVALGEFAFQLEVEVVGEIAAHLNPCSTQPEPVVDCSRSKPSFEREDVAAFPLDLKQTTERKLDLGCARNDVDRLLLLGHFGFLDDGRLAIRRKMRALLFSQRSR